MLIETRFRASPALLFPSGRFHCSYLPPVSKGPKERKMRKIGGKKTKINSDREISDRDEKT